jgi:hypothetical protein
VRLEPTPAAHDARLQHDHPCIPVPRAYRRVSSPRRLGCPESSALTLHASRGVAVAEISLSGGEPDYTLFVLGRAIGILEARKERFALSGVEQKSAANLRGVPSHTAILRRTLCSNESTGCETWFTNHLDPEPHSRAVFSFLRLQTRLDRATKARSAGSLGLAPTVSTAVRGPSWGAPSPRPLGLAPIRLLDQILETTSRALDAVLVYSCNLRFSDENARCGPCWPTQQPQARAGRPLPKPTQVPARPDRMEASRP